MHLGIGCLVEPKRRLVEQGMEYNEMSKSNIDPLDATLSDFADMNVMLSADGTTVTLSGVPRIALLNLLTSASLFRYENPFKPSYIEPGDTMAEIKISNAKSSRWYNWQQNDLIDMLEARLKSDGNTNSVSRERKMRKNHPEFYP